MRDKLPKMVPLALSVMCFFAVFPLLNFPDISRSQHRSMKLALKRARRHQELVRKAADSINAQIIHIRLIIQKDHSAGAPHASAPCITESMPRIRPDWYQSGNGGDLCHTNTAIAEKNSRAILDYTRSLNTALKKIITSLSAHTAKFKLTKGQKARLTEEFNHFLKTTRSTGYLVDQAGKYVKDINKFIASAGKQPGAGRTGEGK